MRFHLHLLRQRSDSDGASKLRVAMTEFWPSDPAAKPKVATFGKGMEFDHAIPPDISHHPQHNEDHKGLRGLAILLLRYFGSNRTDSVLEGELASSLAEVLRRSNAGGNKSNGFNSTWLQTVFGVTPGQLDTNKVSKNILSSPGSGAKVDIGPLWAADNVVFEVYLHETLTAAKQSLRGATAARARASKPKPVSAPLPVSGRTYLALADELEGEVTAHVALLVRKNGHGQWIDPEADGALAQVLPLTVLDVFQIRVTAKPQAHFYVVWVDSIGNIVPVYPWSPVEQWEDATATSRNTPKVSLTLTDDIVPLLPADQRQFRSEGASGAETFVVLAHREPLDLLQVRRYFEKLVAPKKVPFRDQTRLERFSICRSAAESPANAFKAFGLAPAPGLDPLDKLHHQLETALSFRLDHASTLIVPSLGGEPVSR